MAADMTSGSGSSGPGKIARMLGVAGAVGVLCMLVGIAMIAYFGSPPLAAGFALVIAGVGLLVKALVSNMLSMMGMGGMF